MIRLGKNGEIIVQNGFNSGTYKPRSADRSNVYLGETTKEDMMVKKEVRARQQAETRMEMNNRAAAKRRIMLEMAKRDYHNARSRAAVVKGDLLSRRFQDRETHKAILSGRTIESNKFMGSPFAGFGNAEQTALEQRIDPDSIEQVEIVDADLKTADPYGIKTWMESSTSEYTADKIEDSMESYTPGKVTMQTMVDYASQQDKSLISFPKTMYEMSEAERAAYALIMEQTGLRENSNKDAIDPKIIKYGLYALGLYLLLK